MSLVRGWVALCVALAAVPARGQEAFPYVGYINADEVYVRSGPGDNYYPTQKLRAGDRVEVYRHDPGGWFAVRPPEGSFSWVSARYLEPGPDGLAVVRGEAVASRVGTQFSDLKQVIQVRLEPDEEVVLFAPQPVAAAEGQEAWYKIHPPSGEFRWIHGRYIDRRPPSAANGSAVTLTPDDERRAAPLWRRSTAPPAPDWNRRAAALAEPAPAPVAAPPFEDQRGAVRVVSAEQDNAGPRFEPPLAGEVEVAAALRPARDERPVREQLEDVEMELSRMLAEEPTAWSFVQLQARAEALYAQAETAVERGMVRAVLNRISAHEELRRRYQAIAAGEAAIDQVQYAREELAPRVGSGSLASPRYDAWGYLRPVAQIGNLNLPDYVLLDATGQAVCYLDAAPEVNLRSYLGQWVGVWGTWGYVPELRARQVTVQRAMVLDPQGRR